VRPKRERKAIKMLSLSDKPKNSKKKTKGDPCVTKKRDGWISGRPCGSQAKPQKKEKIKKMRGIIWNCRGRKKVSQLS
jgi:hypothetical protein